MNPRDGLYVGMGAKIFCKRRPGQPREVLPNSATAHTTYQRVGSTFPRPTLPLGTAEQCSKRTIYQYLRRLSCRPASFAWALRSWRWAATGQHALPRMSGGWSLLLLRPGRRIVVHMMGGRPDPAPHLHNDRPSSAPAGRSTRRGHATTRSSGDGRRNQDFDMDPIDLTLR